MFINEILAYECPDTAHSDFSLNFPRLTENEGEFRYVHPPHTHKQRMERQQLPFLKPRPRTEGAVHT